MIYLSGGAPHRVARLGLARLGIMLNPNMGNRPDLSGIRWAVDTGCYSTKGARVFDVDRYLAYLAGLAPYRASCLFATAPDVFGDGAATLAAALPVLPRIRMAGYPAALVAQPGITVASAPWPALAALFIGGPDHWQVSAEVAALIAEARRRGMWVHRGRVNSLRRLRAAQLMDCDSADGTFARYGPDIRLPQIARWLVATEQQRPLFTAGRRSTP